MAKVSLKQVLTRLTPKYGEFMKLINYIYSIQGTEAARLDFSAAAKVLGADWKTVKRLCDKLAKAQIIYYEGAGLRLNSAVLIAE